MRNIVFGLLFFGQLFMFGLSMLGAAYFFGEQNNSPRMFLVALICSFIQSTCTMTILAEWAVKERWQRGGEK